MKTHCITFRVEAEIRWQLDQMAAAAGISLSEFLRHLVVVDLSAKGILQRRARDLVVMAEVKR